MSLPPRIAIVANGEAALRLSKRVGCAARALGVEMPIEFQRSNDGSTRVLIDGDLLFEGLQRTEDIEQWLSSWLAAARMT